MWAVITRTRGSVSGVEMHPLLFCSVLLWLRGGYWGGYVLVFWHALAQQLLGEHLVLLLWPRQEWVRMPLLLTERWGRDPGLFIFAVSLHLFLVNPVQPKMLRNESSSQTWVMRVWKTGKAVKLENWWLDLFTLKSSWRRGDNLKAQSLMNERFWEVVWELFSLSVQGNDKDVQWSWKVAN